MDIIRVSRFAEKMVKLCVSGVKKIDFYAFLTSPSRIMNRLEYR